MPTESSVIANEIDAIISRAMAEYTNARGGINPFGQQPEPVQPEVPEEETLTPEVPDIIPTNSSSVLIDESTSRFTSAIWYDNIQTKQVTLAGLGGIGSYVAFLLARMKPHTLILYDNDTVEGANMSGQLYGRADCGVPKVVAIDNFIFNYANYTDTIEFNTRFTQESTATDIMICGFDNMEARKIFYNSWINHVNTLPVEDRKKCLFIDGRLAAESFQVLCMKGDDTFSMQRYSEQYLFSDAEAEETVCSYKQTTFMANMIGSVIVNLFTNFCANECEPLVPRDLPFFTEYSAETMYFKVVA